MYENIAFSLEMLKWDKARIRKRVDELLALLKIEQFEKRYPAELSGGQQQQRRHRPHARTQPKGALHG